MGGTPSPCKVSTTERDGFVGSYRRELERPAGRSSTTSSTRLYGLSPARSRTRLEPYHLTQPGRSAAHPTPPADIVGGPPLAAGDPPGADIGPSTFDGPAPRPALQVCTDAVFATKLAFKARLALRRPPQAKSYLCLHQFQPGAPRVQFSPADTQTPCRLWSSCVGSIA